MHRITGRELPVSEHNLLRTLCNGLINGEHLINHPQNGIEGRLNGVTTIYGSVPMKNFLSNFSIGDQPLSLKS